jgi:hypothetical protein
LGFKYPINLNNPDNNNEISQIKKIFKFPLSNKVFDGIIMYYLIYRASHLMDPDKLKITLDNISEVNPALTCYHRNDPAPVLPLRDEPDLLSWLENTGRLVSEKDGDSQEISTIEEEELSALMGEKEDYKTEEDPSEDDWED